MTDHGYTPTRQEAQARETAAQAERHWWVSSLRAITQRVRREAAVPANGNVYAEGWDEGLLKMAGLIDALCAERERP